MKTIICGAGDVGYSIADKLSKENFEVTVIDESEEKLSKVSENLDVKTINGTPSLPTVLMESAVLKTFVISSNCETGPKEILLNGKAGALFEVSNSKHLANKILYFKKKKLRKKMVKSAYLNLYRFNYQRNLKKYLNVITN